MDHKSPFIQSFDSTLLILTAKTPFIEFDDICWCQKMSDSLEIDEKLIKGYKLSPASCCHQI